MAYYFDIIHKESRDFMNFKVMVGVSNRHVHLTKEVFDKLFDTDMECVRALKQTGEFASNLYVTIEGPKGKIEHVRVLGPLRNYVQVEVSALDAFTLGVEPPVRKSGDLKGAATVTLHSEKGSVVVPESCILAQCHIHMSLEDLKKYGVNNEQVVKVHVKGKREGIFFAHIKASENGVLEFHIDRDEANAMLLKNNDELIVEV